MREQGLQPAGKALNKQILYIMCVLYRKGNGDVTERERYMMDLDEGVNDSSSPGPETLKRCRVKIWSGTQVL